MSAITSASGSTVFASSPPAGAPAAGFSPRISASTSASGSTTLDLYSDAGIGAEGCASGAAGAPASMSAPMNDGGA